MVLIAEDVISTLNSILAAQSKGRSLNDLQTTVLLACWQGQSYRQIASQLGYQTDYIKRVGAQLWQELSDLTETKITKKNCKLQLSQYLKEQREKFSGSTASQTSVSSHQDWGDAVNVSFFQGRKQELTTLSQWILHEHCALIALCGVGGMGKSALSVKLAQHIQDQFDFVIWRSLRDTPPYMELIADLLQVLSHQQLTQLPPSASDRLALLIQLLQRHRCLIVLDNVESLLQAQDGAYLPGYEDYGNLFHRVGEVAHTSCLLITSRELPETVATLAGKLLPVRALSLPGLDPMATQTLLQAKGLYGTPAEISPLVDWYRGNPLALKIVATVICDQYAGNIHAFLTQGSTTCRGIRQLLEQQLQRLSELERQILTWLAIRREPSTIEHLATDLISTPSLEELAGAIDTLHRRSLIETIYCNLWTRSESLSLQPVIMEQLLVQLIAQISQNIVSQQMTSLGQYALMQVQAKDYIRDTQIRLILQPILRQLAEVLPQSHSIQDRCLSLLNQMRGQTHYGAGNLINLLRLQQFDFTQLDLSHLILRQADLRGIPLHHANLSHSDLSTALFSEKMGTVLSLAYSPDGQYLAIGNVAEVRVYRLPHYQQHLTLTGHKMVVMSVTFSPDGQRIISGSTDQTIKIWDIKTGHCLHTLVGHKGPVMFVQCRPHFPSPSDSAFTVVSSSGSPHESAKLWHGNTGSFLQDISPHAEPIRSVAFSADGYRLALGYVQGQVAVMGWDADQWTHQYTIPPVEAAITEANVAFNPMQPIVAVGFNEGTIGLWNLDQCQWQETLCGHEAGIFSLQFSPNGQQLISGGSDHTVRIWNARTGQCLKLLQGHTARVSSVQVHPSGQQIASASEDHTIRIWDIQSGQLNRRLSGHNDTVWSVAWCGDVMAEGQSQTIASGSNDNGLRLWDLETGGFKPLPGSHGRVQAVAYSSHTHILASASFTYELKIWDLTRQHCLKSFGIPGEWCWAMALNHDGTVLASSGGDNKIHLWDVQTGEIRHTLTGHQTFSLGLAFSPDNQQLASGGMDQSVKIWDVQAGKCLQTFKQPGWVWSLAYHPHKPLVAVAGNQGDVTLLDLEQGQPIKQRTNHGSVVHSVCFSSDGQYLASCSQDQTICLWDGNTGECLRVLTGHQDGIFSVAFMPEQPLLVSGGLDETVKVWNIQTGNCLHTLRPPQLYEGMNISGVLGLTSEQKQMLQCLGAVAH